MALPTSHPKKAALKKNVTSKTERDVSTETLPQLPDAEKTQ
jgi:hypothetical protein